LKREYIYTSFFGPGPKIDFEQMLFVNYILTMNILYGYFLLATIAFAMIVIAEVAVAIQWLSKKMFSAAIVLILCNVLAQALENVSITQISTMICRI